MIIREILRIIYFIIFIISDKDFNSIGLWHEISTDYCQLRKRKKQKDRLIRVKSPLRLKNAIFFIRPFYFFFLLLSGAKYEYINRDVYNNSIMCPSNSHGRRIIRVFQTFSPSSPKERGPNRLNDQKTRLIETKSQRTVTRVFGVNSSD